MTPAKIRGLSTSSRVMRTDGSGKRSSPREILGGSAAFGDAILIVEDTLIVGAPGHTHGGIRFAGAVYVFARNGENWVQGAKLTADDAAASDGFGSALAMSGKTAPRRRAVTR